MPTSRCQPVDAASSAPTTGAARTQARPNEQASARINPLVLDRMGDFNFANQFQSGASNPLAGAGWVSGAGGEASVGGWQSRIGGGGYGSMLAAMTAVPFSTQISDAPFRSPPPKVSLTNGFIEAYDNSVATARTCYNSRIITPGDVRKDEKARALRDRIARETYDAGHHTTLQHATFQFTLENVTRQAIWSLLHAHPFYNSEQVSQRYVEVKAGNVVLPALAPSEDALYRAAVDEMMAAYRTLIELLTPRAQEEFFRLFPGRKRTPEKWTLGIKKKAQEIARYVLPIGTFAHLYHTISGLTLHRY